MTLRTVNLSPDGRTVWVACEYNDEIRVILRSFGGSAWDGQKRLWLIPVEHLRLLMQGIERFDFLLGDEVQARLRTAAPGPARPQMVAASAVIDTYSVGQISHRIGNTVHQGFPQPIWVRGELASYDKSASRAHVHFELIEKTPGSDEVSARLPAVLFATQRARIEKRLRSAASDLVLRDGLLVRLQGRINYQGRTGRVELVVQDVDAEFAIGQMALRRQQILDALGRDQLRDRSRNLPWPMLPLRIGLITARESDAYHDIVQTLTRSRFGFEVWHYPAAVQGPRLEPEVVAGLDYFERNRHLVDVVVLARGGGARADLAWFDNSVVAYRVARHPLKVVIAIGHERDRSVLDEIASSERTPTAVAERLVGMVHACWQRVDRLSRRLVERTTTQLAFARRQESLQETRLKAVVRHATQRQWLLLDDRLRPRLEMAVRTLLRRTDVRLTQCASRLRPEALQLLLRRHELRLTEHQLRLQRGSGGHLKALTSHLAVLEARTTACDPRRVLERGYAIVRDAQGRLLRESADTQVGAALSVELRSGALSAQVTAIRAESADGAVAHLAKDE